ncbi:MAG TPA: tRNA (guanosine(46)-N7)-methyltransferase TrmB [Gammaproteobacteria bacterium]|nr:tRNA (guanosine(46)-N7)-methyltransferase TrmB [Gammaproteobacteria bacterium]
MNDQPHRHIQSFVRREGRITPSQQNALDELWPRLGVPFENTLLDMPALFGRDAPRTLEIGFGNGETLVELARQQPEQDFFGIEVYRPGIGRLLREANESGLTNLRVSNHDAVEVLATQIPDNALDALLLYFPDPWPKKRHHKRRIVQPAFCQLVARKLKPQGQFHLATDWQNYAEHMLSTLMQCPYFDNVAADNTYVPRPVERPVSKFERRGQRLGHDVWDLVFRRNQTAISQD